MQVRKQLTGIELDMEQQTGSKQEKEYIKAVYCHPAYFFFFNKCISLFYSLVDIALGSPIKTKTK